MSFHASIVITRDDGTQVRPPAGLWSEMTRYDFNPFHAFGLYTAIACYADGAPLLDVIWFVNDAHEAEETRELLSRLSEAGFLSIRPDLGHRYFAMGLEDV